MYSVNLEEYTEGNSALHRLDARIKLICAIATIFCIVFLTHWELPLLFFVACIVLVLYSRAPLKVYFKRLLVPISLIAFVAIIMPFTYGSTVIARVPFLTLPIYSQGIYFGVLVFTRCISAVSVLNVLILVTPITTVMDSLAWFRVPSVIIDTMFLMFRYIGVLSEESTRMYRAQESRCGHSRSVSYFKKLANYGNIAGALLLRAFDRSVKVGEAMASRAYSGKYTLFTYEKKKLPKWDVLVGSLIVAASVSVVIIDAFIL
ncbi:MAG: cobalt ECF transporter T component CbiQ [Candidatus Bathyarchaeia archaeon]|jgi:cobalt/nickel transport system permease protein